MAMRGEVWLVDLDPTLGHEQAGRRPALVVSADAFNLGPAGLVVVVPMTTTDRRIPLHVRIDPPEGGLRQTSFAKCEDVRSLSVKRLGKRLGVVGQETIAVVEDRMRIFLDL